VTFTSELIAKRHSLSCHTSATLDERIDIISYNALYYEGAIYRQR